MKLNDLDLNKLVVFAAIVDHGSVVAAAGYLGRTSSAVSQALTGLEASLETRLFDRVGKRMLLTRAGRRLYHGFRAARSTLEGAVSEATGGEGEVRGLIRVGLFLGFPRERFARFASGFAARYPDVALRVMYAPQRELAAQLRANRLDYVFSFQPRSRGAREIVSTSLFTQELALVTGPDFFPRGFALRALEGVPVVDYYQSDPLIERWLRHHYPEKKVEPRVRYWAATTDLVLDLVALGAGVGVLPAGLLEGRESGGSLRVLRRGAKPLLDQIWLLEPRDAFRDRLQDAFRVAVIDEFA